MKSPWLIPVSILTLLLLSLTGSLGLHGQESKPLAAPDSYLQDVLLLLQQPWPQNRTVNLVCHGHSVPAGYFKTPVVDTFNAYPHLLHQLIKQHYPHAVVNVIVTAIGGENSVQGARRFETDVLPLRPDVVLIDYALNDRGIGLEAARAAWQSMIEKALARHIKVILLTPTPDVASDWNVPADPLCQHAQQIRQLAQQHGVALVDSLQSFRQAVQNGQTLDAFMSQGNHPNRQGHDLVVKALAPWFTPVDKP